jgi:hypothetical protein
MQDGSRMIALVNWVYGLAVRSLGSVLTLGWPVLYPIRLVRMVNKMVS